MDTRQKQFIIETLIAIRDKKAKINKDEYIITISRVELDNLITELVGVNKSPLYNRKKYFCPYCADGYKGKSNYERHLKKCMRQLK